MLSEECKGALNILKEKLVITLIMVYLDWNKQFHVHIYASGIFVGVVLAQSGEGILNHPPVENCPQHKITILQLKGRHLQWYIHSKNS